MFIVYLLYSTSSLKTYVGYTTNIERRLKEHNFTESKGFTLRYRPWLLIYTEKFETKSAAMAKEKFYKSGKGREVVHQIVTNYLTGVNN